ncbi:hypothetical protein Acr_12g0006360 [Actinidia rufa]|uniref:Bifunctional inhibitor/plant lipid transfer protein/seed storage helical domain-containing protein n=1 Tax=Actinidia rufa TaxID=165716 RepID=A0A7J0FHC2_9ERIC|nr:hypothetical protein Acr_12g0006360 [Actinidia rufa]
MEAYSKKLVITIMVVLLIGMCIVKESHAQGGMCNLSIMSLLMCKPAMTPPKPTPPSEACCSALSNADLACLCQYKHSPLLEVFNIDANLLVQLPTKCKLPDPPKC